MHSQISTGRGVSLESSDAVRLLSSSVQRATFCLHTFSRRTTSMGDVPLSYRSNLFSPPIS